MTALITGVVVILMAASEPAGRWSHDTVVGGFVLGCVPIAFGTISLAKHEAGRWMAITGLVLGAWLLLASLGSM